MKLFNLGHVLVSARRGCASLIDLAILVITLHIYQTAPTLCCCRRLLVNNSAQCVLIAGQV